VRECPAYVDDPCLPVEIAPLERDPLAWPQAGGGGEDDHRLVDGTQLLGERLDLGP
jgi:hypothetical protein